MPNYSDIIGHEDIVKHFKSSIELGKVSHAYILNGEKGSGKKTLAAVVAKSLQCEAGEPDPCGTCKSCLQAESGNQPDIIWVNHEKPNVISVDEIRSQILNDISLKPYSSRYKIYIVPDAQLMNQQAQNAILKTLEEPPEYAIIMLLTNNVDKFLPTIISRCIVLNFRPVEPLHMMDYLMTQIGVDEEKARFCTDFAQGNLGKAVRLAISPDYNEIKEDSLRLLRRIQDMDMEDIIQAVRNMGKYKLDITDYIDIMTMWFRDILMVKISNSPNKLIFKDEYSIMRKQASHVSYEGLEEILQALEKLKIRLEANVNFDIAMELMLLTVKENLK
ncbi:MAG: DNA polymerase III subunit [Lachnospiraceae bacterium]|nr:DNA polymerase III subunit [Lachnospiraceae bacterium]HCJ09490.1 DNA polymerase III subunit delta [Lachnospiraceae bacterium]